MITQRRTNSTINPDKRYFGNFNNTIDNRSIDLKKSLCSSEIIQFHVRLYTLISFKHVLL